MNPWMKWILLATPLALTQCRSSSVAPIGTVTPDGNDNGNLAHGQGNVAYEAPPHTFSARPHPPRSRSDAPPPNLAALPKMVQRMDQCYGGSGGAVATGGPRGGSPIAKSPSKPAPPKPAYKQVKYNQSTSPSSPSPVQTTPVGGTAANKGGGGIAAGRSSSSDYDAGAAAPQSPPPPPATQTKVAGGERAEAKREAPGDANMSRLEKKKKDRGRDKAAEATPAAAAASMGEGQVAYGGAEDESSVAYEPMPRLDAEQYSDWGQATYLSNDDTMSLSSAQRVIFAIDKFLPVPLEHIRPHELLNYFSFETAEVAATDDFSVLPEIAKDPKQEGIYNLALAIRGRPVDKQARRNGNLTFVVDRSGSMSDEGRMDYLKRGMRRMIGELKTGDLVNVVLFDHEVCVPVENFVVGRDKPEALERAIDKMKPRGSTDVHAGLTRGYELADRGYQPTYNNRVVLVTDALANTGNTDPRTMAMVAKYYDERKIRLSGVGVGTEFNDALLDKLTERGKGAYVFLGSEAEVDAVFGPRFISLLETTAMDVHFQLHLPPSLRMNVFYGEESSAVKEDVQAIHYFANTSQLFLSDVMARGGKLRPQDQIMLTIEYEDPESGQKMLEERAFSLAEIEREAYNIRKGRLLIAWADRLALMASRPQPMGTAPIAGAWIDADGWQQCEQGKADLRDMSQGMNDPEVTRVVSLWDKFCARYEQPRNPVRRTPASQPDGWPGAR
ncbi:VWA domain-containing protein [Nannocystis sp. SCPEA4]|uniref:vWA domain-containing protein n=1 Tax=Nannocystis sp. SCPEA4 TaxID=2996787 RepID=UPI002271C6C9|nr:VWA domain-containing protein [Nannocystis sp. SCPEA4]MCY1058590.1 VWA domain-containing protein [Nannocystis sp. SCPEA4]